MEKRRVDNSSLFESDFSEEYDSATSSEELIPVKKNNKKRPAIQERTNSIQILVVTTEEVTIEHETKILIESDKNCKITLPLLVESSVTVSDKGQIYESNSITIMTKKKGYEHIIMSSKGNYINGNSIFYTLKGGNSVTLYSVGRSWYADR